MSSNKIGFLKSFFNYIDITFEEIGIYKAVRAPILLETKNDKIFFWSMVLISIISLFYFIVKVFRWLK